MTVITIRDIRRIAEQESSRHFHYYIGVEHLFIAMTKLKNGITNAVLEQIGLEPRFVRYSIRQEIGVGDDGRYWAGFRDTPRTKLIQDTAQKYAGIHTPTEQHLLLAILDEGDSIPVRVLQNHKINLSEMRLVVSNWAVTSHGEMPPIPIEYPDVPLNLGRDEILVLQRMFRNYHRLIIERELGGSYTGARLLVVRPQRDYGMDAQVVVKIAERSMILHEQLHYETFVKTRFPPTTAHLLDTPALPDDCPLGGLKYALVRPSNRPDPINLRDYANEISPADIGQLIRDNVYRVYLDSLWAQRQRYRFGVWREYEHVLPPALEIDYIGMNYEGSGTVLEPLGGWSRQDLIRIGQVVLLRKFVVQKTRPQNGSMQIAAGAGADAVNRASKVEVFGMGHTVRQFRRGEMVDLIVGKVRRRRKDILAEQVQVLSPNFKITDPTFPHPYLGNLPNPLFHVDEFLERQLRAYLSVIHGDFHLGNILVGPAGDAWLIDFAMVREGHTMFDWAMLEISLLNTVVVPHLADGWVGIWNAMYYIHQINDLQYHLEGADTPLTQALQAIIYIREIVQANLTKPDRWHEYHVGLFMLLLRGLGWEETTSTQARRLLFGMASLSILATYKSEQGQYPISHNANEMPTDTHQRMNDDDFQLDSRPPTAIRNTDEDD